MPGLYGQGDYDLAGFALGAVERGATLPRLDAQQAGDVLIGVGSNGVHSNGYSLARMVVERSGLAWSADAPFASGLTLAEALMAPTRIYVRSVLPLAKRGLITGGAHITGGGLIENPPRAIAEGLVPHLDWDAWPLPPVFQWLQQTGGIADHELRRTFNCGIGFVVIADPAAAPDVLTALLDAGEAAWVIGELRAA
jgi:phosphoribosylaminoimidazole synthetase